MTKHILLRLGFLAAVAVAGFLLLAWWTAPTDIVTVETFEVIYDGMPQAEAAVVLGNAGKEFVSATSHRRDVTGVTYRDGQSKNLRHWQAGDRNIVIGFDSKGTASSKMYFLSSETLAARVRRWLRF